MKQTFFETYTLPDHWAVYFENGFDDNMTAEEEAALKAFMNSLPEGARYSSKKSEEPYFSSHHDAPNVLPCNVSEFWIEIDDSQSRPRQHMLNRLMNKNNLSRVMMAPYAKSLEILFRNSEAANDDWEMLWCPADSYGYTVVPLFMLDLEEQCEEWDVDIETLMADSCMTSEKIINQLNSK